MMKKARLLVACLAILFTGLQAQQKSEVLLTIEDEPITKEEFLRVYNKNNNQQNAIDPKTVEEYLELYINFKLKVKEAEALGMDTAPDFVRELSGYRRQLAQPYLTDRDKTSELVKEAYERLKQDVRASHILVRVSPDASPQDTLKAYTKIMSYRRNISDPEKEFGKAAAEMSEDPSAKQNYGDLGYFTAFQMVYPFENAAFNTPVGEISKPVRSRFGYHLVYVHDKRPARGEMKAAHILIKVPKDANDEDKGKARQKVNEIYNRLQQGEDFAALARQYSDDKSSANKGGELPMFGVGRMVPEFEDAAFSIEEDGGIAEPIQTEYGWHIIKRIGKKELPSYEEMEKELKRKVSRDGRNLKSKDSFYNKLRAQYPVKKNKEAIVEVVDLVDVEFFEGKWRARDLAEGMDEVVVSIEDTISGKTHTFTQYDFADFLERNRRYERTKENIANRERIAYQLLESFIDRELMKIENNNLEAKYPDFKAIMQEYRDGILLFELMDKKVWTKALRDTSGLESFYEANKNDYMWDQRVEAKIFVCNDEKMAKKARRLAKKQKRKGWSNDKIREKLNDDSQLNVQIREGKFEKGDDPIIDKVEWEEGLSDNMEIDNKIIFVSIWEVIPPTPKELSEARGIITADYQNQLEEQWVNDLREKYSFQVNQAVLESIK